MTEFEARRPLDRVLIVCPSRLRDKWREELNRKFGQDFDVFTKQSFLEAIERQRQNPQRGRLRAILSFETLRSEQLGELVLADLGYLDFVVIDEAHHARNPATQTSELLRELCKIGKCVIMLTATPLHLGSRDLFTLLQALRPVEFRDPNVFDLQLRRHTGVHEAGRRVRTQNPSELAVARDHLEAIFLRDPGTAGRDPWLFKSSKTFAGSRRSIVAAGSSSSGESRICTPWPRSSHARGSATYRSTPRYVARR